MVHRANPNRSAGYTLVEIMVVLIILGVSAAVVVPQAVGTTDLQAQAAARTIASDLEYARDLAITTATPTTVTFSLTGNSYRLSNASGNLIHPITKAPAYVMSFSTQSGFSKVKLATASFNGNLSVTFDVTGAPDNSGTVTLQSGTHTYTLTVGTATGKVSVSGA